MSAAAVLVIFSVGLAAGALVAIGVMVLLRRNATSNDSTSIDQLGELLEPLRVELERYDQRLTSFDRERAMQFGALSEQLHIVAAASEGLRDETQQLSSALRAPGAGGRWGELQLRRVVELAGMAAHCDFEPQVTLTSESGDGEVRRLRPDMVVRLPGERAVIVDAKAPLGAYLEASTATDARERTRLLRAHAAHLRGHVDALARKAYWEQLGPGTTPEFVVLFLPARHSSRRARARPGAARRQRLARRHPRHADHLIALLRAVSFGWREARMAEGAREIGSLAATLYERLASLGEHFTELGGALNRAVVSYNRAAGTLESRVFVTARRFRDLGVAADRTHLDELAPVEPRARVLSATELTHTGSGVDHDG
jgi:Uncharacterized protein conserved in bacteria